MSFYIHTYHVVFSTAGREPLITEQYERDVYNTIFHILRNIEGVTTLRIGGMPDHVHILVSIPPKYAVSQLIMRLKRESSFAISQNHLVPGWHGWQNEYGSFTVSSEDIDVRLQYIMSQKEHHHKTTFADEMKQLLRESGYKPDETLLRRLNLL